MVGFRSWGLDGMEWCWELGGKKGKKGKGKKENEIGNDLCSD
jgi:hypothetical protein